MTPHEPAPALAGNSSRVSLELLDIDKRFGGVQALSDVSVGIAGGTVHALIGENGAGKSTLGKIVAGVHQPDAGTIRLNGRDVSYRSPREALAHGVATVAQEPSIVPHLTVAQNVFLGAEPTGAGFVRRRRLDRAYSELAASAGFDDLPGRMPAGRLRTSDQQKVEILRALSREARLIVMDEPTAALGANETHHLHEIVRRLAAAGKTIILISHFLREVLELADSVTVLRDGHVVKTASTADETEASLVEAMLGRPLTTTFPPKRPPAADARVVLSVRGLSAPGVDDASFELRAGEIVGLAGLVGAGRTELGRAIFGAARIRSGHVGLGSGAPLGRSPSRSIRSGLGLIPESRKDDGLLFLRSSIDNATLSRLGTFSTAGVVRRRRERRAGRDVLERCGVRGASFSAPVSALSGGNQQKVLLARTLLCEPDVIIADEPTRGVDVGAKRAIYDFFVSLADEGLGVLLISSELEEVMGLSHRVLVMRAGRLVAEFAGDAIGEGAILAAAFADAPEADA